MSELISSRERFLIISERLVELVLLSEFNWCSGGNSESEAGTHSKRSLGVHLSAMQSFWR